MANPKRRHSKSRRDKRRANWKVPLKGLSVCPQCKQAKLPHQVCLNCGFYNDVKVVKTKTEVREQRKRTRGEAVPPEKPTPAPAKKALPKKSLWELIRDWFRKILSKG